MGYPSCLNDVYARYGRGGRAKTAAHAKAALAVSSPSGDVLQRFLTGARQRLSGTGDSSQRLPNYSGPGLRNATNKPSWLSGGGGTGTDMLQRLPGSPGLGIFNASNKPSWLLGGGGTGTDMLRRLPDYSGPGLSRLFGGGGTGTDMLRRLPYYPGSRPKTGDMLQRLPDYSGLGLPRAANKPSWLSGGGGTGTGDMLKRLPGLGLGWPNATNKPSWLPLGAGTERENKSWTRLYNPLGTGLSWLNDPDYQRWEEQWGKKLRSYDFMSDPQWQKQWSKMLVA